MAKEKHCIVSPLHTYTYCPKCDKQAETWRNLYCSENCRNIYHLLDDYKANKIDANNAKSKLEELNIPSISDLNEKLQPIVEKIYAEAIPIIEEVSRFNKRKNKRFVEETPVEEVVELPIEEFVNEVVEEPIDEIL